MEFVNLTPHAIAVYHSDGTITTLPPSGQVARLVDPSGPRPVSPIGGLPAAIYSPLEGRRLEGLPTPRSGVLYVTSVMCLPVAAALGRFDVAAPDTDGGAVRVPRGEPNAGALLGTTRLLLAGDEPPAYRLLAGSATHESGTPRDLDVIGYGDADDSILGPVTGTQYVRVSWPTLSLDVDSDYMRGAIDYHEQRPALSADGAWVIRVPVWGEEDPSRPALLWHSPCARPVRVERQVLATGPAQLRRYAATGVLPDFDGPGLADHGRDGHLVVEMTVGSDDVGYRGCGLLAWRRAAERLGDAQMSALGQHVQEFLRTLIGFGALDLHDLAAHAAQHSDDPTRRRDRNGSPAGSGGIVTYYWDGAQQQWTTPYAYAGGGHGYDTFADVLAVWS